MESISKLRKVMVALDLSYMDDHLIKYVQFLEKNLGSIEHVVLYHNIHFDYPEEAERIMQSLERPLEELLKEKIEGKATKMLGNSFEVVVDNESDTAVSLVKQQQKNQADLILFGKKVNDDGSGYLIERALNQKVSSHVLVIPETAFHSIDRISVPVDFSKHSSKALSFGMYLVETLDAEIDCHYVYSLPNVYFPYVPVKDLKEEMISSAEKKWNAYFKKYFKGYKERPQITYSFHAEKSISQLIFDHAVAAQANMLILPLEVGVSQSKVIQLLKTGIHIPLLMVK